MVTRYKTNLWKRYSSVSPDMLHVSILLGDGKFEMFAYRNIVLTDEIMQIYTL